MIISIMQGIPLSKQVNRVNMNFAWKLALPESKTKCNYFVNIMIKVQAIPTYITKVTLKNHSHSNLHGKNSLYQF